MANSKIYLGNTNIGSLFKGASDISIYLGENKVYPLEWRGKFYATYSGGETYDLACDGNTTLDLADTRPSDYQPSAMTEAIIGDCVTEIGGSTFNGCRGLTSIVIPNSVTTIGAAAFWGCTSLTSIDIPSGVTSIGDNAFRGSSSLISVTVNATTPPTLGSATFDGSTCPIYVPCESVEAYKSASGWSDYADRITCPPFEGKFKATYSDTSTYDLNCDGNTTLSSGETKPNGYVSSAMTTAVIGDCVTTIGADAFRDCSGLTSITIPSSVTSISDSGMRACTSLSSITLPDSVTTIGANAFRYCINLSNVNIPSSVTSIGVEAFRDCRSLTNINIPSGVTSIGISAFLNCTHLESITVGATTPPTLNLNAFYNTNNCPIYVPYESLNVYKSASGWSPYASRIKPINDYFRFVAKGGMTRFKLSGNTIDYSLDYGKTWTSLASDTYSPLLSRGETIMFKATNLTVNNGIGKFISAGDFDVEGNIMSLVAGDDYKTEATITNVDQFRSLFDSNSNVINASGLTLPATTISQNAYRSMFYNCSNLVTAPELPATTLGESCYKYMFRDCTSLTKAPELPATSLTQSCYSNMFNGCTSLTTVSADMLPATALTRQCYEYMFSGCTSLITSYGLTLPAPTLEYQSYRYMFAGCSSLTFIECLATDISAYQCTTNWVSGVTNNGHFVESCNMSNWTSGVNGIPNGWDVACQP